MSIQLQRVWGQYKITLIRLMQWGVVFGVVIALSNMSIPHVYAQSCTNNSDCPTGQECRDGSSRGFQGLCVQPCGSGNACDPGYACQTVAGNRGLGCVQVSGPGTLCSSNSDCTGGLKCNQTNSSVGQCIISAQNIGESCLNNSGCDTGYCRTLSRSRSVCALPPAGSSGTGCTTDADCSAGLRCNMDGTCEAVPSGACGAPCTNNSSCSSGLVCNHTGVGGTCINTFADVGTSCSFDGDCRTGYCHTLSRSSKVCATRTPPACSESTPTPQAPASPEKVQPTPNIAANLRRLNPLEVRSIPALIGSGLRLFTGIFGSIALVMIVYGGLTMMTARGQGDKMKEGANIVLWASIGLITMMLSYVLVLFVFGAIT